MKIGVTFGCYCPLHRGHLDVIYEAKKTCDKTIVFVCGTSNDKDDRYKGLVPLDKRFILIRNFLHDDSVDVIKIDDADIEIDESGSESNWSSWLEYVQRKIYKYTEDLHKLSADIVWFFSEPEYIVPLVKYYGPNLGYKIIKKKRQVSGTECRNNPILHWSEITAPFRPYHSHNILVSGTESEGKTTLVSDIGKYFSIPYSYEKARDLYSFKNDHEFGFKDFLYNITEQNRLNESLISSPWNPGVFISDSDNMTTLMYAKEYAHRQGFSIFPPDYKALFDVALRYKKDIRWDKIFLLKPSDKPIVDDGTRLSEHNDYSKRLQMYYVLKDHYDYFGYEYEELEGRNYQENFLKVKEYIESVFEGKDKQ